MSDSDAGRVGYGNGSPCDVDGSDGAAMDADELDDTGEDDESEDEKEDEDDGDDNEGAMRCSSAATASASDDQTTMSVRSEARNACMRDAAASTCAREIGNTRHKTKRRTRRTVNGLTDEVRLNSNVDVHSWQQATSHKKARATIHTLFSHSVRIGRIAACSMRNRRLCSRSSASEKPPAKKSDGMSKYQ